MTKVEAVEVLCHHLSEAAILEQLAEESSELAQAASKFARKLRGENPTPKTETELAYNLQEEYEDVLNCSFVLHCYRYPEVRDRLADCCNTKVIRWAERLEEVVE